MIQQSLANTEPMDTVGKMKHQLLSEALKYDLVLDLHCDTDAVLHLYTNRLHTERARKLAHALGASVVFVEDFAGGQPFDEAILRTWKWFSDRQLLETEAIPFSVTVELRGQADVSDELAKQDAQAIIDFLISEGLLSAQPVAFEKPERVTIFPLKAQAIFWLP